jgi:hypothetical protein
VVEFLNEQMTAEVIAVEVQQYVGEGLRILVPRVIGQTAGSDSRSTRLRRQPRTGREDYAQAAEQPGHPAGGEQGEHRCKPPTSGPEATESRHTFLSAQIAPCSALAVLGPRPRIARSHPPLRGEAVTSAACFDPVTGFVR